MPDQDDIDEGQTEDIDPADLDDLGDLDEPDTDEDESEDEDGKKPYKPPSQSEWNRLQRRIKRLTKAKDKPVADVDRQLARQLGTKGKAAADEDDEPDTSEADRWRGIAVQNAAASQIAAAGFTGTAKQAARLARLIDTGSIQPDRDGTFDLEDEIEELQEEYPQLFQAKDGRRPAPRVRRADNRQAAPKDPTRATSDALLKEAGLTRRTR
jgi:hypothetical protein